MQSFTVFFLLQLIFTVHAEVVQDFKNKCDQFFYKKSEPQLGASKSYVRICQTFLNQPRFATLYDTDNRIPVYSAYIFEKNDGKCPRDDSNWRIEPQLVHNNWDDDMMKETELKNKYPNQKDDFMGDRQAINSDYAGNDGYDCGHLNPNQHHKGDNCRATFTRTNTVPQNSGLNRGSWKTYETRLRNDILKDCKTAYVLVGAIPSDDDWVEKDVVEKNKKRKKVKRVNIPDKLWHAYCCLDNNDKPKSGAAHVQNIKSDVVECSVKDLEKSLGAGVQLFNNCG